MATTMNELKCLHDELDLANAAASELHVAHEVSGHVLLDTPLDFRDLVQQIRRGTSWVNKRLMLPQKLVSELTASRDAARFYQSDSLPGFTETRIVIFHALERSSERTSRTFRTKAKIDAKERAVRIGRG